MKIRRFCIKGRQRYSKSKGKRKSMSGFLRLFFSFFFSLIFLLLLKQRSSDQVHEAFFLPLQFHQLTPTEISLTPQLFFSPNPLKKKQRKRQNPISSCLSTKLPHIFFFYSSGSSFFLSLLRVLIYITSFLLFGRKLETL